MALKIVERDSRLAYTAACRRRLVAERLGISGLYVFGFAAFLGTAPAHIGLALMLLGFFLQGPVAWRRLFRTSPAFWTVSLAGVSLLATWRATQTYPVMSSAQWGAFESLIKASLFLVLAWWLKGNQRRCIAILTLATAGFFLGRILEVNWNQPWAFVLARDGLGLPVIAFGEYCAAIFLGVLLLGPRFYSLSSRPLWHVAAGSVLFLVMLVALTGVVGSASRGVWLSLLILLPFSLGFMIWYGLRKIRLSRRALVLISSPLIVACVVVGAQLGDFVDSRVSQERATYEIILQGDVGQLGHGSIATRVHMILYGIDAWQKRPWLGWGVGGSQYLLQTASDANLRLYRDLHNAYIEVLVGLGVVGFVLCAGLLIVIGRWLWFAIKNERIAIDLGFYLASGIALHLLAALSNYRMLNVDWTFYWILFSGAAVSFWMWRGDQRAATEE